MVLVDRRQHMGSPVLLGLRGLYYGSNHFRRELKLASNESPLSMTPINNGLRSCWYSSSAYFTAGLAGNLSRPCAGSIGCGPEKRRADLSPRRQRNRSASPAGDSASVSDYSAEPEMRWAEGEGVKSGFVEIPAQTLKRLLREYELGVALSLVFQFPDSAEGGI
jgi:hypothetical protein